MRLVNSKEVYFENGLTEKMLLEVLPSMMKENEYFINALLDENNNIIYEQEYVKDIEGIIKVAEDVNEDLHGEELIEEVVGYVEYMLDELREDDDHKRL